MFEGATSFINSRLRNKLNRESNPSPTIADVIKDHWIAMADKINGLNESQIIEKLMESVKADESTMEKIKQHLGNLKGDESEVEKQAEGWLRMGCLRIVNEAGISSPPSRGDRLRRLFRREERKGETAEVKYLTQADWGSRPLEIGGITLHPERQESTGNMEEDIKRVWLRFFADLDEIVKDGILKTDGARLASIEAFTIIKQNEDDLKLEEVKEYLRTLKGQKVSEALPHAETQGDTPEQVEQQKEKGMLRALFDRVRGKRESAQERAEKTMEQIRETLEKLRADLDTATEDEAKLLLNEITELEKKLSVLESPDSPRLKRLQRVKGAVQSAQETLRRLEARGGTAGGQKDYNPENLILGQADKALRQMTRDNLENANRHARKSGSHLRKGIEGIAAILYGAANVVARPVGVAYEATRTVTNLGASGLEAGASGLAKAGKTIERAGIIAGGATREATGKTLAKAIGGVANIPEVEAQINQIAKTRQEQIMADQAQEIRELKETMKQMMEVVTLSSRKMENIEVLIEAGRLKVADTDTE